MKFAYVVLFIGFLSSCSYYRFKHINLVKVSSTKAYEKNQDSIPADVFVHLKSTDGKEIIKLSNITTNDSSFVFKLDSVPIHAKQRSYYYRGLRQSSYKQKRKVSGRIGKGEENYVAQIHLLMSDSLSIYDSTQFTISNSQISEVHIVQQNELRSFLLFLVALGGVIAGVILIIFIAFITSFSTGPIGINFN